MSNDDRDPATPHDLSDADWATRLDPERFRVLREGATERAFTGRYWDDHRPGVYRCAGCGTPLFDASTKYDSGSGWPSFYAPIAQGVIGTQDDRSIAFMPRTEIHCARCGGHLGHVFDDGPNPTGLRFCTNSASLVHEADLRPDDDGSG